MNTPSLQPSFKACVTSCSKARFKKKSRLANFKTVALAKLHVHINFFM